MDKRVRHMMERFPERAELIKALEETNARFKDLIGDHYETSEELARLELAEQEANAARKQELEQRLAALEEEYVLIINAQQRT